MAVALVLLVLSLSVINCRRRFDIFTLAFASCVLYFIPALVPLSDMPGGAYLIYSAVFILVTLAGLVFDKVYPTPSTSADPTALRLFYRSAILVAAPLVLIGIVLSLGALVVGKNEGGGLLHYSLAVFLGYAFASAALMRKWFVFGLFFLVYGWIIVRGDRTQFVIAVIALALLSASVLQLSLGSIVARIRWPAALLAAAACIVGLVGKDIYGAYFDWNSGSRYHEALQTRLEATLARPERSFEAYHVQSILAKAVLNDDRLDASYLVDLPLQLLPLAGALGAEVHAQSEMIKGLYFADWSDATGVSSNYFAEGFLIAGYVGVLLFTLLYIMGLWVIGLALRSRSWAVRLWAGFAGAFWAFYIHRSSLFQLVAHEKRIFYSMCVLVLATLVMRMLIELGRRRPRGGRSIADKFR